MLTKQELKKIDKEIDCEIKKHKLLTRPFDTAMYHLLVYYEDYNRIYSGSGDISELDRSNALKNGQDGLHFAILWIYKYCGDRYTSSALKLEMNIYEEAAVLHNSAMNYSVVWDSMTMLLRDLVQGELESDKTIVYEYPRGTKLEIEITDRFISAPDDPEITNESIFNPSFYPDLSDLVQRLGIKKIGESKIKYSISNELFAEQSELQRKFSGHTEILDASWNLGGYSVSDLRRFYNYLKTICFINEVACFYSGTEGGALECVVLIKNRKRWMKEIQSKTNLTIEITDLILRDFTFNYYLYEGEKKKPDVTYQPFFELSENILMLSPSLLIQSNVERNTWDLISILREGTHAKLRNLKESIWVDDLRIYLEAKQLKVFNNIPYTYNSKGSDVDLLVVDEKNKFVIISELKWITGPDRIKDVLYLENELLKGIRQCEKAVNWIKDKPDELKKIINLDIQESLGYEIRSIVISKTSIGSHRVYNKRVPVINERLLRWILDEPHNENLKTLWVVGSEMKYLVKKDIHYKDEDLIGEFGGFKFIGKNAGIRQLRLWDPKTDINI